MYEKFLCFMYSVCMDSMSFYVNAFSSFASTPWADVFVAAWSVSFQQCAQAQCLKVDMQVEGAGQVRVGEKMHRGACRCSRRGCAQGGKHSGMNVHPP